MEFPLITNTMAPNTSRTLGLGLLILAAGTAGFHELPGMISPDETNSKVVFTIDILMSTANNSIAISCHASFLAYPRTRAGAVALRKRPLRGGEGIFWEGGWVDCS